MRVGDTSRPGRAGAAGGAKAARGAGGAFQPSGVEKPADAASPAPATPVATLGALLALQVAGEGGGRAKLMAAARRALDILDDVQRGLLEGRVHVRDLEALVDAASAKSDDADPALADIYAAIALRARVELAKFGR